MPMEFFSLRNHFSSRIVKVIVEFLLEYSPVRVLLLKHYKQENLNKSMKKMIYQPSFCEIEKSKSFISSFFCWHRCCCSYFRRLTTRWTKRFVERIRYIRFGHNWMKIRKLGTIFPRMREWCSKFCPKIRIKIVCTSTVSLIFTMMKSSTNCYLKWQRLCLTTEHRIDVHQLQSYDDC